MNVLSLFTGIEGFDLGFNNAGMKCLWQVEIDKHCQAVLRHNSPNTEKSTDVKKVGKRNLKPVGLICGGFPCQDLSVAGKRKGMDGERSGLWYEFARIIAELKPPWVVIENVPGLLSSNKGNDFAIILRWLGECGYYASWRILDSQYWGVAQRRRRLFVVGSLGNTSCAEILFESEGMPWNSAKGKKKREGVAATISRRPKGRGYGDEEMNGNLVAGTLPADYYKQGGNAMGSIEGGLIAATETGAGFWSEGKPRLRCSTAPGQPQTILAFQSKASSQNSMNPSDKVPALSVGKSGGSSICFQQNTRDEVREIGGKVAGCISAEPGMKQQNYIAGFLPMQGSKAQGMGYEKERSPTLKESSIGVQINMVVRRLTPRECERLQGFPGDWTRYGIDENGKKIEISDTQRYKMAGNAVTRNVPEWMGKRIVKVHEKD